MKILTANFRVRGDSDEPVTSHYRAQHMTGEDVLPMLRRLRADLDAEIALVEQCPAVRTKYGDG